MRALATMTAMKLTSGSWGKIIDGTDETDVVSKVVDELDSLAHDYMASVVGGGYLPEDEWYYSHEASIEFEDGSHDFVALTYGPEAFRKAFEGSEMVRIRAEYPMFSHIGGKRDYAEMWLPKGKRYTFDAAEKVIAKRVHDVDPTVYSLMSALGIEFKVWLTHPGEEEKEHTFTLSGVKWAASQNEEMQAWQARGMTQDSDEDSSGKGVA